MTARAKTKAKAEEPATAILQRPDRIFTDAEQDRILRSQCLALACSMACEEDSTDEIIRGAQACFDWIKNAKVPVKTNIRAVT